jgi:hypothetical protein
MCKGCVRYPLNPFGMSYSLPLLVLVDQHIADSVVSRTGFVQLFNRVCVELKARGANDFVELRK